MFQIVLTSSKIIMDQNASAGRFCFFFPQVILLGLCKVQNEQQGLVDYPTQKWHCMPLPPGAFLIVSFLMSPLKHSFFFSLQSQTPSAKQKAYFQFCCFSPKLLEASVPHIYKYFWVFGLISATKNVIIIFWVLSCLFLTPSKIKVENVSAFFKCTYHVNCAKSEFLRKT